MGILDNLQGLLGTGMDDPRTLASLQLAQGLLGRGGGMQRLAGGLQGYGGVMAQAAQAEEEKKRRALQERMQMMQLEQAKAAQAERMAAQAKQKAVEDAYRQSIMSPAQQALAGGGGPTVGNAAAMQGMAPKIDQQALIRNLLGADPMAAFQMMQPEKPQYMTADGAIVQTNAPGGPKSVFERQKPPDMNQLMIPDGKGGYMVNQALLDARGQIAARGAARQNVTVGAERAFTTELAKLDAKQLDTMRDAAEKAQSSLSLVRNLRSADEQGAYSGGFADQKLAAANLINGLTGATPKGLVGSQLYNAEASKLVLESVKALGANPSNADVVFIQKTVPQLATSAGARKALTDFIEAKAARTVQTYRQANEYARKNSGLTGFEGTFPQPAGGDDWSITPVPGR